MRQMCSVIRIYIQRFFWSYDSGSMMIGAGGHSLSIDHEDSVSATGKSPTIRHKIKLYCKVHRSKGRTLFIVYV